MVSKAEGDFFFKVSELKTGETSEYGDGWNIWKYKKLSQTETEEKKKLNLKKFTVPCNICHGEQVVEFADDDPENSRFCLYKTYCFNCCLYLEQRDRSEY